MVDCIICEENNSQQKLEKNGYVLVKCNSDAHLYISNPPNLEELSAIYSKEYFEGTAKVGYHHNVFENTLKHTNKAERKLRRLERFISKGKILDVGCGPGYFLNAASNLFSVDGCDLSQAAVDFAQKSFGLDIKSGDFLDIECRNDYDAITMFSFLEHTLDPRKNLEKANALLKDNGLLMLSLPNVYGLGRYLQGKNWRGFEIPEHLHFFNEKNLRKLLIKTGFSPVSSEYTENNFFRDTNYFYARKV